MNDFYWKMEWEGLSAYQSNTTGIFLFADQKKESFSLEEGWKVHGLYVFAPTDEELKELLYKIVRLNRQFEKKLRLIWVENPKDPISLWRYHALQADDKDSIIGQAGFRFGEYYFNIFSGQNIVCTEEGFTIAGKNPAGVFKAPGMVLSFFNGLTIQVEGQAYPGGIEYMVQSTEKEKNLFELLEAGMYYTAVRKDSSQKESYECQIYSPVLEYRDSLLFNGVLHPAFPFQPRETFLAIPSRKRFLSKFVTTIGERLEVESLERASLVFEHGGHGGVYLGLSGCFSLHQSEEQQSLEFLCGTSGMEYLSMSLKKEIQFVPGQNAYLSLESRFENKTTVSYLRFPAETLYYCQPETAPLFASDKKGNLSPYPLPLLQLRGEEVVPVFPYFGCEITSDHPFQNSQLEPILFQKRYESLSGPTQECLQMAKQRVVSSKGMLAGLSGQFLETWNWMAVGRAQDGKYMKLLKMDISLSREMMRSDAFVVFYCPEDLTLHTNGTENFELFFGGWRFLADPACWRKDGTDSDTIMLIKYSTKESIKEKLQDQTVFLTSLAQCYDENHMVKEEFSSFLNAVEDPNFQGCLILNCPVDTKSCLEQMQPEVRVMLEGIGTEEREHLYAHHLILHKSQILPGDVLETSPSSVDGVVYFKDGIPISYSSKDQRPEAEYATTEFVVQIQDSKITELRSVSELVLNSLFGVPPSGAGRQSGTALILDGQLIQEETGCLFVYKLREKEQFVLEGSILEEVLIHSVELTGCQEDIEFEIGGRLYFMLQEDGDFFGYGFEKDGEDRGLPFQGLRIGRCGNEMDFRGNYRNIFLLAGDKKGRRNAMISRFPMELKKFVSAKADTLPETLGYMLIQSPLRQSSLGDEWYGLVWRIPLGSLGELSENSLMDLELITAWSGAAEKQDLPGCWLGGRLPSLLGGSGLDLQGLVKLGFHSVEIRTTTGNDHVLSYQIQMNQFKVRILWASFPPGSNCIQIVADDEGKRLGWYAGYADLDLEEREVKDG